MQPQQPDRLVAVAVGLPVHLLRHQPRTAPGGLILQGWNTIDAQNNRTNVSLSGQRFNVPVADSAFSYRPIQRRGPRR